MESKSEKNSNVPHKKRRKLIGKKAKKIIVTIFIAILVIAIIVIIGLYLGNNSVRLWMDKYILGKDVGEENLPKIDIEQSENISVYAYGGYVATLGNGKLTIYNNSANVVNTIDVVVNSPKFCSYGKYLLIADQEGQNLYLIYNDSLQWHKEMEGDISQIYVNKNGAVCAVLSGTTYKSIIVMFNINGNEEFRTFLSTTTATDVTISDDNKYLSYVEIKTAGTTIESLVKTISIEKAKNVPSEAIIYTYTTSPNSLLLKIKYKNDKVVAYCDEGIHIYQQGNDEEILKFDNKVNFADINLNGHFCLVRESDANSLLNTEYELKIQNVDSKKEHTHLIKSAIKNIYCKDDIIAINLGNEVEFVNTNGWLTKKFTSLQNIRDIKLGDEVAAIIYKSKIEILSL